MSRKRPKSKQRKTKRNKRQQQTKSPSSLPRFAKKIPKWTYLVFLAVMSLLGWFGDLLPFASRVTIGSANVLDPSKPFSTQFQVSNDGIFEIYNVRTSCGFDNLETKGFQLEGLSIERIGDFAPVIAPGIKHTFDCSLDVPRSAMPDNNTVYIMVSYTPRFLQYTKKKQAKFITKRDSNNQLIWVPRA